MKSDMIYDRRSIRKFLPKDVPLERIDQLLDAGRVAPSAKNRQPWQFIVLANKSKAAFLDCMEQGILKEEKEKRLLPNSAFGVADAKNTLRILKEAPVILTVLNTNGRTPFAAIDTDARITELCDTLSIGAAMENIILKAAELGLGTLWVANTCFAYEDLVEFLHTQSQLIGVIAVGYAAETPPARPRKALRDIVIYRLE